MSTTWYVPVGPRVKNAELAIRKMTGWKKYDCPENSKNNQVLTDGENFVHCDREPITILDHGQFATLERYGCNDVEDTLMQIDGTFNDLDDPTVISCDYCGAYMMTDEMHVAKNQEILCRVCIAKKPKDGV